MERTAKQIIERQGQMEKNRRPYEDMRDYCTKQALPSRENIKDYLSYNDEGQIRGRSIFDGSTPANVEIRANGIMAWFMPRRQDWFVPQMADLKAREFKSIRKWLQNVHEQLKFALSRSNYYEMKRLKNMDADVIGSAYLFIDEDVKTGKTWCTLPHPRYVWRSQDIWGQTTEIHYQFEKTLAQIAEKYGRDKLTSAQQAALKKEPDTKAKIIHAINRNPDYQADRPPFGKNRRWLSWHVNCETNSGKESPNGKIIQQGGYNTLNPVDWELNKSTHELYGRGTVSQFIIDIITANNLMADLLLRSAQSAQPPMIALDILKPSLNLRPGGVTFFDNRTLQAGGDIRGILGEALKNTDASFAAEMHQQFHGVIETRLGVQFFKAMQMLGESGGDYKNQLLVNQVQAERAALMSPFLNTLSIQTDLEMDRFFEIEYNAGRIEEPPPEFYMLQNSSIDLQYTGPILQILKQFYEKSSLYAALADIQAVMTVDEQARLNIDVDQITQKMLQSNNLDEDAIVPIQDVKLARQAIAQQAEAAQNMAMAQQMAPVLSAAGQKVDESSILAALRGVA